MPPLDNVLNKVRDGSVAAAKAEFQDLLNEAKGASEQFISDNATKVETWITMLSNGEIDKEEFDDLIADQRLAAEQFDNTQRIEDQQRRARLTLRVLQLAATTIGPALLAAL